MNQIEGLMTVAAVPLRDWPPNHHVEPALRDARMCYDHLAGRLGVALCDMLQRREYVLLLDDGGEVTGAGERFLSGLGVDLEGTRRTRRRYCRACIDWTERRHHLSGAVGAALARAFLARGWIARIPDSRALTVTVGGRRTRSELGVAHHRAPAPRSATAG